MSIERRRISSLLWALWIQLPWFGDIKPQAGALSSSLWRVPLDLHMLGVWVWHCKLYKGTFDPGLQESSQRITGRRHLLSSLKLILYSRSEDNQR